MIDAKREPVSLEFPLRGEWYCPNTPGNKIPSHGTNRFGSRYAYDFVQVDWKRKGRPAYRTNFGQYLFFGVPIENYYCWGQEVFAPCDGIVVKAEDGCKERRRSGFQICVTLIKMLVILIRRKMTFNPLLVTISL
ncbi:hypothetical protein ACE1TF_13280 [Geomicrobium sp. JSM 1781026]|uniref:hypothetical protein n=1 Tax=Geomicrobium sp. JSM 1781026 TaxID=3344580 RepID=UPI0035BF18A6